MGWFSSDTPKKGRSIKDAMPNTNPKPPASGNGQYINDGTSIKPDKKKPFNIFKGNERYKDV